MVLLGLCYCRDERGWEGVNWHWLVGSRWGKVACGVLMVDMECSLRYYRLTLLQRD